MNPLILKSPLLVGLLCVCWLPIVADAQATADPELLREVSQIKAIDNHAHPLKYVAEGEKPDDEFDALPLDSIEPFPLPTRLKLENPEFIVAWREMYGYAYRDMSEPHVRELLEKKQRLMRQRGDNYPAWILDQLNIETMFANRVVMGRGLVAPHFRWVAFDDALMFPLSNEGAKRSNADYRGFYPAEERLLKRYLADLKINALPATLEEYLAKIVTPTLEQQKRNGAIAIKFEAAYLRKLDFDDSNERQARRVYDSYVKGGEPPAADYKALQDFLFRYISREAGRLGLAVHIHSISGAGGYYRQSGSDPLLLESAFNDPTLRKTNFVIIHGGYPFTKQTGSLLSKPNVYADFSAQTFFVYPRELSEVLRNWLESYPDKVLFGTDAFSFTPAIDWGEVAWLSNTSARKALALALTGMINDGEITRQQAVELARMVLRSNAIRLYKLAG
jgi:predicted TIM-barrel fold metal-dependent hydrolase